MKLPSILWVGPMLGKNPGWVTTQGEILADLFAREGYGSLITSSIPARFPRLADTLYSIFTWRRQYDLAVLNVFSGPAFWITELSSRLLKQLGKPMIMVLRGGNLPEYAQVHPAFVTKTLKRANQVVAPSAYLVRFAHSQGVKASVIPNVLDLENYPFRLREICQPNLLWIRTFHPIYNPEMAVEVYGIVREAYPQARLVMSGQDKGLVQRVKEFATEKKLDDGINLAGFLTVSQKQQFFSENDIYLHTNRIDNMPVSVVEAAAFGLPVVATRVGGISDLLENEKNALIVESGDAQGMADAILRILQDARLASQLSMNGRNLAEQSGWKIVKPQWELVFQNCLLR